MGLTNQITVFEYVKNLGLTNQMGLTNQITAFVEITAIKCAHLGRCAPIRVPMSRRDGKETGMGFL